jgi:tRNA modification GTPase
MAFNTDDTICAIATAPGGAGRGMVRVSGPAAVAIAAHCFESTDARPIQAIRHATALAGRVRIEIDATPRDLPCDLFLWPTGRSYTREPIAELHTFGSPPLLQSLVSTVCQSGARLAEPGEFTLRAFLAGRLDLTQAEAVLGVIDARGSEDLDAALVQLAGGLARPLDRLRDELLQLLAELEAGLDFVEEDIEFISPAALHARLELAVQLLNEVAQQMVSRHVAADVPQIALVGPPNVGKSTLFNALVTRFGCGAGRQQNWQAPALVSPQRGTTRDYLTARVSLNGMQCELVDTAGIDQAFDDRSERDSRKARLPSSTIDKSAQSLAAERRERAAIRAYCAEARDATDEHRLPDFKSELGTSGCGILVLTKADMMPLRFLPIEVIKEMPVVLTSSRNGQGLEELCATFGTLLTDDETAQCGDVVAATANRCRESVRSAESSLKRAAELVLANGGNELVAVELRGALDEIGSVVGAVYTDDLLDRIFGTFCIGK